MQSKQWCTEIVNEVFPNQNESFRFIHPYTFHSTVPTSFSQIVVQASYEQPLSKQNCFIFHMLPYKSLIAASPINSILDGHFSILAKSLLPIPCLTHPILNNPLFSLCWNQSSTIAYSTSHSRQNVPNFDLLRRHDLQSPSYKKMWHQIG